MAFQVTTERIQQIKLANYLKSKGILFFHCPNGGKRDIREASLLKRMGCLAGIPDIIILDAPPHTPALKGIAIEMKIKGGKVSSEQKSILAQMQQRGWQTFVAYSSEEAIAWLMSIGLF